MAHDDGEFGFFLEAFTGGLDRDDPKPMYFRTADAADIYTQGILGTKKRWDEFLASINAENCNVVLQKVEEITNQMQAELSKNFDSGNLGMADRLRIGTSFNMLFATVKVVAGQYHVSADIGKTLDSIVVIVSDIQEESWAGNG